MKIESFCSAAILHDDIPDKMCKYPPVAHGHEKCFHFLENPGKPYEVPKECPRLKALNTSN